MKLRQTLLPLLFAIILLSTVDSTNHMRRKKKPLPDPFDGRYTFKKTNQLVNPLPSNQLVAPKSAGDRVKPATKQHSHDLPPAELLRKLERVHDMLDFVREFKITNVQQKYVGVSGGNFIQVKNNLYSVNLAADGHVMNNKHGFQPSGQMVDMQVPASTGCMPRYKLTKIEKPAGTYLNWPACVYAKQCGGCCVHDFKECVPTQMVKKKHKIFRIPYYNDVYPVDVEVYDHVQCQCQCSVKESDCINAQDYDDVNCQCTCPDSKKQHCPAGKFWSQNSCSCECNSKNRYCNSDRAIWDHGTCQCRCKPTKCPHGYTQDVHSCVCANTQQGN